jgi:hypothetical protein
MMHIERLGRRTLVCGAVLAIVGLLFLSRSPAQELKFDPPKQQQLGRYQIVMHPTFRGDQYLLDTITGQIWQLTKFGSLQGEPLAWMPMTKIDSDAEYRAFITSRKMNDASTPVPASASAPAARPKPAAPVKLN